MSATQDRSVNHLALLVGSSPLPNYLAVQMLRPHKVWPIYTPETRDVKDRLIGALERKGFAQQVEPIFLEDAGSARLAHQAVESLPPECHLHYTGGTKAMGVHIYRAWAERCGGRGNQASYLDDGAATLRFDDGLAWPGLWTTTSLTWTCKPWPTWRACAS